MYRYEATVAVGSDGCETRVRLPHSVLVEKIGEWAVSPLRRRVVRFTSYWNTGEISDRIDAVLLNRDLTAITMRYVGRSMWTDPLFDLSFRLTEHWSKDSRHLVGEDNPTGFPGPGPGPVAVALGPPKAISVDVAVPSMRPALIQLIRETALQR
jgi:hypothetical protein